MSNWLSEQFEACKESMLVAILDSLHEREEYITSIERTALGLPVTGLAVELAPWHGNFGLSLRLNPDFPQGQFRYESADWPHFNFTEGCRSPSIATVESLIVKIYERGKEPNIDAREMAHLVFLAGAEALLDPTVSQLLNRFGIDAPELHDSFVSSAFQYIVTDYDATVKSNYCDIVLSNRVTKRLLGNLT